MTSDGADVCGCGSPGGGRGDGLLKAVVSHAWAWRVRLVVKG